MSEPRIYDVIAVALDRSREAEGFISVVEKSVYDALAEKLKACEAEEQKMLARLHRQSGIMADLEKERDQLKREVERLKEQCQLLRKDCSKELKEKKEWKSKYEASEWVRKDTTLRTYDGLTEKNKRYRDMCEKLAGALKQNGLPCAMWYLKGPYGASPDEDSVEVIKQTLAEYEAMKK